MKTETTFTKDEIAFADLRATDAILIQTQHSVYQFTVINPAHSYGRVTGAAFKDDAVEAVLCEPAKLRVGARVRLIVGTVDRCRLVTTSIITRLTRGTKD